MISVTWLSFSDKKKVNARGHVPVQYLTMTYSVNRKGRSLLHGKTIDESLRGSIIDSIIVEGGDPASGFFFSFREGILMLPIGLEFRISLFQSYGKISCTTGEHLPSKKKSHTVDGIS